MLFYIGFKADYTTPCKKRLTDAEQIGTAANGAEIWAIYNANWDNREWFYTVHGGAEGLAKKAPISSWTTPEQVREQLAEMPEETAEKYFPGVDGCLEQIEKAIALKEWTGNDAAYFCELCGRADLAARVLKNRAEIKQKREEQEAEEAAERARQEEEQRRTEQEQREKALAEAENTLRAGKFITAEAFEQLAQKYGVKLPIKFVGWLREWCGGVQIMPRKSPGVADFQTGREIVYKSHPKHRSQTIWTYADKLGAAMAI